MSINKKPKTKYKACKIFGFVIIGILFAVGFALLFSVVVVYLWNWLMVDLFNLPTITYLQAFGIIILAKILFGGFGHHQKGHKSHFQEKFRQHFDSGCGSFDSDDEHMAEDLAYLFRQKHLLKTFWKERGREEFKKYKESCCGHTDGNTEKDEE